MPAGAVWSRGRVFHPAAALAWGYVTYDRTPAVAGLLYGVVPVVIAIVAHAVDGLARVAVKKAWYGLLGASALAA